MQQNPRRSWLYVPADKEEWFVRLQGSQADVVVLDLEDGVAEGRREIARKTLSNLKSRQGIFGGRTVFIRMNAIYSKDFSQDLKVVRALKKLVTGVVLPKVEYPKEVVRLDRLLKGTKLEIVPVIEMLQGERRAYEIAESSRRITALQFAESGDYGLDFGLFGKTFDASRDLIATDFAIRVIKTAKSADLMVLDGAYLNIRDLNGLKERCKWAVEMGFDGKAALHPDQTAVIDEAFSPKQETIQKAREMIQRYEMEGKTGAFVPFEGSFITPPIYKMAKRFLKKYDNES